MTRRPQLALAVTVALLVVDNVLSNRVLPSWMYLPTRLVTVGLLLAVATRLGGCDAADLGLDRSKLKRGLIWGTAVAALVLTVMVVSAAVPITGDFYRDDRAGGVGPAGLAYQVLLRIPFGTVVPEELFFRGVVLGLSRLIWKPWTAVAVSAALFGLWHVLPAQTVSDANQGLADIGLGGGVVISAVLATAGAGALFAWLRLRSESLLAPMLLHLATNAGGFTLAWLSLR